MPQNKYESVTYFICLTMSSKTHGDTNVFRHRC